jgi:hypothetical protein
MLGSYPFSFPEIFTDLDVRDRPPLHHAVAIAGRGVSFGFTIVVGRGNEEERDQFVAEMIEALTPARHDVEPFSYRGNAFVRHEIDHVVGATTVTSTHFVGFAFGDLVHGSTTYPIGDARAESLHLLAVSTLSGAIVMHGPGTTAAPRRWWKFWGRK